MRHAPLLALILLLTAGCVGTDPAAIKATMDRDLPDNYKSLIIQSVRKDFFDPYSIRSAGLAEPRIFVNTVVVCIEANAKNKLGGYTGLKPTAYVFNYKQLSSHGEETVMCPENVNYRAFPELEHIT